MASISSLSGSTNSALSSLRGYGGLSSGLDRDTLIEGMTSATQAKITKNQQAKQKLEWQQQAYRNISDKLIAFADKYTATMTSKTNLFSDSFWNAANTIVNGKNSKYIGVTGTSKAAANVSILGVQQMAKNASLMTGKASDSALKTGAINTGDVPMNTLDGKELNFKIGDNGYAVVLPSRLEPYAMADGTQDVEAAAKAINAALRQTKVDYTGAPKDDNMFNHVEAQVVDGKIAFVSKDGNNKVTLHDSSALEALGFTTKPGSEGQELTNGVAYSAQEEAKLIEVQDFAQRMGEKELTFNYNGKSKTITLPSAEEIRKNLGSDNGLTYVKDKLQESMDAAFGKGRVKVNLEDVDAADASKGQRLTFKTTIPNKTEDDGVTPKEDTSSTLTLTGGWSSLMSSYGGLDVIAGESNRVNLNISLKDSGMNLGAATPDANGKYKLNINGTDIEFSENDSMNLIMKRINEADAGVKISYLSTTDKFVVEATEDGAAGLIQLKGEGAKLLFGQEIDSENASAIGGGNSFSAGQDAIVAVKYAGSDEVVELTRGNNSFSIEGLDITVKGKFGYDDSGNLIENDPEQAVTFTSNIESDKIASAVSDLVKEYNEILELVNKELTTRPDRDYTPLTSEQKKELSEDEVKLWEEKAKSGLLYNSSELRSLADDLRWMINPADQQKMSEMGISVSTNWQDNGKLSFDENKFKAALEKDPDAVKNFFTKEASFDEEGYQAALAKNPKTDRSAFEVKAGFAVNLKNGMDKYVKTLGTQKGILIEKAGSTKSPLSILNNSISNQIKDVDKILANLKVRLKSEQDRYISQFTQLETLISQMNSQSSYLSGLGF